MGFILIGVGLAFKIRNSLENLSEELRTLICTLIIALGIIFGCFFPVTYGNNLILKSFKLAPVSEDCIYLIIDSDTYTFNCKDEKENFIGSNNITDNRYSNKDIRIISSLSCQFNYCVEYPTPNLLSFALLKFPHYYYEFAVPDDGILAK